MYYSIMNTKPIVDRERHLLWLIMPVLVVSALLLRAYISDFVLGDLVIEDGHVFINDSYEFGIRSLWMPVGGYYFLYHRVVAMVAAQLPLVITPYIFLFGWLLSFLSIAWVLQRRAKDGGLNGFLMIFVICAIALQPNLGGVFFYLNSAHFYLGVALAFYVCIPSKNPPPVSEMIFLILACLSGPFAVVLVVMLALQLMVLRDFVRRKAVYIIVLVCALAQGMSLLESQRVSSTSVDTNVAHWLQAVSAVASFGMKNGIGYVTAAAFWIVTGGLLVKWIANKGHRSDPVLWLHPLFAAAAALLLLLVSALATGEYLPLLSPLGFNGRYFLIPYSLAFYVAVVCASSATARSIVLTLIVLICAEGIVLLHGDDGLVAKDRWMRGNIQWAAYTKFQRIRNDLVIPINPAWPVYPPFWHVQLKGMKDRNKSSEAVSMPVVLRPGRGFEFGGTASNVAAGAPYVEAGSTIYFDIKNACSKSTYLGLEVDIWRSRIGWARVSWGESGRFAAERSLRRFYPHGSVVMQFAFRRDLSESVIRFDPTEGVPESEVRTFDHPFVRNFVSYLTRSGVLIGEATKPGGDIKLREARLYCLE